MLQMDAVDLQKKPFEKRSTLTGFREVNVEEGFRAWSMDISEEKGS